MSTHSAEATPTVAWASYYIDDEKPLCADTDDAGMVTAYRDTPNGNDRTVSAGNHGLATLP